MLSDQEIIKVLIRHCGCTGWSASLIFSHKKNSFLHGMAEMVARHTEQEVCIQMHINSPWTAVLHLMADKKGNILTASTQIHISSQSRWICNC